MRCFRIGSRFSRVGAKCSVTNLIVLFGVLALAPVTFAPDAVAKPCDNPNGTAGGTVCNNCLIAAHDLSECSDRFPHQSPPASRPAPTTGAPNTQPVQT